MLYVKSIPSIDCFIGKILEYNIMISQVKVEFQNYNSNKPEILNFSF